MAAASAPLTTDEQYPLIAAPSFVSDLKKKALAVFTAMQTAGATAPEVSFDVDGVPVTIRFHGAEIEALVGTPTAAPAEAAYVWRFPAGWIAA